MQLKINISEDEELRLFIKNLIEGQMKALSREEYFELVKQEINRKLLSLGSTKMESLAYNVIRNIIQEQVSLLVRSVEFGKMMEEKLDDYLASKDWNSLVEFRANQKINALLTSKN